MILNGHIDVVPEGDVNQWEHHPYSGEKIGNRIYGRGTTDMKGGNVALMLAMEAIIESNIELKRRHLFSKCNRRGKWRSRDISNYITRI